MNYRQVAVSGGIHRLEMFAHGADGNGQAATKSIDPGMIRRVLSVKMAFQIGNDVESNTILLQNPAKSGIGGTHQPVRGKKSGQPMTPGVNNDHFSLILHFDDGHHLHKGILLVLTDSMAARKNFSQNASLPAETRSFSLTQRRCAGCRQPIISSGKLT